MKIHGKEIGDPIVIGTITLVSYLCVVSYQAGKLSVYSLPAVFIDTSIKSIIQSWVTVTPFLVFTLLLTLAVIAAALGLIALVKKLVLRTNRGPKYLERIEYSASRILVRARRGLVHQYGRLILGAYVSAAVVLLLLLSSFVFGTFVASTRTSYLVNDAFPSCLVVVTTDSRYVCVDYDPASKSLDKSYRVLEITGDSKFRMVNIETSKPHFTNPFSYIWQILKYMS